jgi:hypothetical protein
MSQRTAVIRFLNSSGSYGQRRVVTQNSAAANAVTNRPNAEQITVISASFWFVMGA